MNKPPKLKGPALSGLIEMAATQESLGMVLCSTEVLAAVSWIRNVEAWKARQKRDGV